MQQTPFRFAGRTLAELSDIAGPVAAYVYSREGISEKIRKTRNALPDTVHLHYSIKANPHALTLAHIASQVDGLDVASHAEMLQALATGISPERISFSGPGKTDTELKAAVAAGIVLHAESVNEIKRLIDIAEVLGCTPNIAIRINPDITVRQSGMVMGGGPQPFGIDIEEVDTAFAFLNSHGIPCAGLHCYTGSQMLNADLVSDLQAQTLDMMLSIVSQHNLSGITLNIGGGFGVPYFDNDTPLDIASVGQRLAEILESNPLQSRIKTVIIELGRYLVAESGIYLVKVIEKKQSRKKQYLVVEGGMNHNLAASGNLGQVLRRNYPVVASSALNSVHAEVVTVVGPLCTPLDILANDVHLPILQPGDYVAVLNSGAYGFSASPHGFLSHPPPVELLL